ncbi:hypothetical protein BV20DRAFT_966778 [Pilatotrama ljubarskyi]|nr:hypothetical protein BV20DRAFT_966778 [Pilatotrama ljubarskyi]
MPTLGISSLMLSLTNMHEYVPELRRVPSGVHGYDEDDEYDVYDFWPSRNALYLHTSFCVETDRDTYSESTLSDYSVATSPTYSIDPNFRFPDTVDDIGISNMGYSRFFRTGLWAQSSRITKRLDAFLAKAVASLHSIKRHFARRTPTVEV